jgi:D-glycero-D-manno-heptose 1,7-bisphosphate phosphatase
LVLLDRDGVINEDVGSPGVCRVDDFRLIPGAARAIARLKRAGSVVCVVTNQTCVGKGLVTDAELDGIHEHMFRLLLEEGGEDAAIDAVYAATKRTAVPCDRRKPAPGMVVEAMRDFGFEREDGRLKKNVAFIGDAVTDARAARNADRDILRILVGTGYGKNVYDALVNGDGMRGDGMRGDAKKRTVPTKKKYYVVDDVNDDPTRTLPPETLPLAVCASIVEAAELVLERFS